MSLPKAILCLLGNQPNQETKAEVDLRKAGFATAPLMWREIVSQERGWMELASVLSDPAIQAWVLAGKPEDFTEELRIQVALISLAMQRETPPNTSFLLTEQGQIDSAPETMPHIQVSDVNSPFAAKLMAARFKPGRAIPRPCHFVVHLDPLMGSWLEIGPSPKEEWQGFMIGITKNASNNAITAFGVGPRGTLPRTTTLEYPMQGIEGEWQDQTFTANAAQNLLTDETACFVRIEGTPKAILISEYPSEDTEKELYGTSFALV